MNNTFTPEFLARHNLTEAEAQATLTDCRGCRDCLGCQGCVCCRGCHSCTGCFDCHDRNGCVSEGELK